MSLNRRRSTRTTVTVSALALVAGLTSGCAPSSADNLSGEDVALDAAPLTGVWRAWLDSPGGALPFGLEFDGTDQAWILNGDERLPVGRVEWLPEPRQLTLGFDRYDSRIVAQLQADGALNGRWTKTAPGVDALTVLDFHARRGRGPRFELPAADAAAAASLAGTWAVDFETDDLPAVGRFRADGERILATFETATGDYRYLAGAASAEALRLSVFDGAHAFLFHARRQPDGTLQGDFWSRDTWYEGWTARPDPQAAVPDAFRQTVVEAGVDLGSLSYPDLEGKPRRLDDPAFAGKARILELFGSWCPNCNDAAAYLTELDERYADRGLSILGLGFELTGDFERDAGQLRTYIDHHGIEFPVLVAGLSEKDAASRAFPLVDRVRAFPTTIFLNGDGTVRAVHSGYSGPATGPAHERLRREFVDLIEEMLGEAESS